MDHQNEEFEAFLKRFHLRKLDPLPESAPVRKRWNVRRAFAAAAVVAAVVVTILLVRNIGRTTGPYVTIEATGDSPYKIGEKIPTGRRVRAGAREGIVIALEDGTRVEARSQSELSVESGAAGMRIRLNTGSIIVNAAQQPTGRLYVETKDAIASVIGTVFLVRAEQAGTRVDVIQGEVQVQQGQDSKKLTAGAHVATAPSLELQSIIAEISWSRNAAAHIALLEQSKAIPPQEAADARQTSPSRIEPPQPIRAVPIVVAPIVSTPIVTLQQEQPATARQKKSPRQFVDGPG